jgi:hypothetical protein
MLYDAPPTVPGQPNMGVMPRVGLCPRLITVFTAVGYACCARLLRHRGSRLLYG